MRDVSFVAPSHFAPAIAVVISCCGARRRFQQPDVPANQMMLSAVHAPEIHRNIPPPEQVPLL
ncbi:MAG: hypothetical protein WDM81_18995 [Rhizomicrobium sp.]